MVIFQSFLPGACPQSPQVLLVYRLVPQLLQKNLVETLNMSLVIALYWHILDTGRHMNSQL